MSEAEASGMTAAGAQRSGQLFDVFLSHSSRDQPKIAALADALRMRGLVPWLDAEQTVPGLPFQRQLADGLAASRCFAVFVGAEDVGSWVFEELDVAVARAAKDRSFRVFLVLLPTAPQQFDPTELHQFLSQRTWVDLRSIRNHDQAADLLARAVRGEPLALVDHRVDPGDVVCPYVGLRAFDTEDAAWFFGRDADIQRMVEKLSRSSFLAVLGRSGSGKSSAVRAGLVPALQAGRLLPGSEHWAFRVLRPGDRPLEALAAEVSRLRPDVPVAQILADLAESDVALKVLTGSGTERERVVWVVDQAEELFTLCDDDDQRRAFTANLLHVSPATGPGRVVVTLRSDFYPRFAELEAFSARIASNLHLVTELDDQQLEQVVSQPAALARLSLEDGLVDRIVGDVQAQEGALPLLQHALRDLWEHRRGAELTHDAYNRIGGVGGSLANRADQVLAEVAASGDVPVVRRLLLELTRLGEGAEDTKQPVLLSQLAAPAYPLERLHRVAAKLADARLVTTGAVPGGDLGDDAQGGLAGDTRVELAHEALIRSWPVLRSWLDDSREELLAHRRIRDAARAWHEQGRPDDLLYRGTALAVATERLKPRWHELPLLESEFLDAAIRREDTERRRTRRRRTRVVAVLSVLTTLAMLAAIVATSQFFAAGSARDDAEENAARALAELAVSVASDDPALALAVSAEAVERFRAPETTEALQKASLAYGQALGLRHTLTGHRQGVTAVALDTEGSLLATASEDNSAKLWDPVTGEETATLGGHVAPVRDVALTGDGTRAATASEDGSAKVWDAETGQEVVTLDGHDAGVTAVAFSHDGTLLATASADSSVKLWDPGTGEEVATLEGHSEVVNGVAFNHDGTLLATASGDGSVKLWDPETGEEVATLEGHDDALSGVAFSHDGTSLATASADRTALVRRLVLRVPEACDLIRLQVTRDQLVEALGGSEPQACTDLE